MVAPARAKGARRVIRSPLHLFLEFATLASFVATAWWSARRWGRDGVWLVATLFALGAVRENFVILERYLYGFSDLTLMVGAAPLIAAIIWGFSIAAALAAAESIGGAPFEPGRLPRWSELGIVALFMIALAFFFEPFLALVEMARWQEGTARVAGVPRIALVGYPSFALLSLALTGGVLGASRRPWRRLGMLAVGVPAAALGHAWLLQRLKDGLGW